MAEWNALRGELKHIPPYFLQKDRKRASKLHVVLLLYIKSDVKGKLGMLNIAQCS